MKLDLKTIRIELAKRKWNLTTLSLKSDIPYSTLIKVMNGERGGSIKTLGKISKALNINVEKLLMDDLEDER